jgi:DNA-binding response OmpR family regulator
MKKTILAIDDSKAIRFLIQTVLGEDYQVITAPDGCTAMHWLSKRNIPDLIICDPQLPDMKDWELIEELSTSILYRNIPLMVISSVDKTVTKLRCEEYGVADYFIKPFNPLSILESINNLLGKKKTWGRFATSLS